MRLCRAGALDVGIPARPPAGRHVPRPADDENIPHLTPRASLPPGCRLQCLSSDEIPCPKNPEQRSHNVVRIGTPDGRRFTLPVPEPLAVAWAGRSPVVIDGTYRPLCCSSVFKTC
jgi:hypothetical protein